MCTIQCTKIIKTTITYLWLAVLCPNVPKTLFFAQLAKVQKNRRWDANILKDMETMSP